MTMDFKLTEEQKMIRDMVKQFTEEHIAPIAAKTDETGEFPMETMKKMGELGLMGMNVPTEYGGAGTDAVSFSLAVEELARHCGSTALTMAAHNCLGTLHIFNCGNEEQRRKYVPKLASGEHLGAWALTEPGAGSDAAGQKTMAKREGDGWLITGEKTFITTGHVADTITIMTNSDPSKGVKGITAFVVEKDDKGFKLGQKEDKLGLRGSITSQLFFEDMYLPDERRIGEEGKGFIGAMQTLDSGRISIGAMSVGLARGAYEESLDYAKTREQFGKPIGKNQSISFRLADMATQIDAARLLVLRSAWMKDQGLPFTKEASMGKVFASEVATWACVEGIQIHGGYGFTRECPVERMFRDVKLCEIGEGSSEVQRIVIGRCLGL